MTYDVYYIPGNFQQVLCEVPYDMIEGFIVEKHLCYKDCIVVPSCVSSLVKSHIIQHEISMV